MTFSAGASGPARLTKDEVRLSCSSVPCGQMNVVGAYAMHAVLSIDRPEVYKWASF